MIVCICRNIKTSEYSSEEEIKQRIMQDDFVCGLCQLQYLVKETKETKDAE